MRVVAHRAAAAATWLVMSLGGSDGPAERKRAVAILRSMDTLDVLPAAERCDGALRAIGELRAEGCEWTLGPNAHHRAMRLCGCARPEVTESFGSSILRRSEQSATTWEILARVRLEHGKHMEAAEAMVAALELGSQDGRCGERLLRSANAVLESARSEGMKMDDEVLSDLARRVDTGEPAGDGAAEVVERTLALLKPDTATSGAASDIIALIESEGFSVLARRSWSMDEGEAADFLTCSWGSSSGRTHRRFFREIVKFYASGEVLALLLEGKGAIARWRRMLGPGDPSVGRVSDPGSVRARFGTNKLANGAHGADSVDAAAREIEFVFGSEWVR